ncbi:ABC transporter [Flavimobilis marinus]|uniref:ABC-2 type transport system ATP-binding protein n=1 Tax=Flavimobilis marinus TaxID=285351 RepID=A0A1I2HZ85_9MICO|nr:ABC transporter ATP-binding protein [Flavimobilis marinus]GHG49234.1 ABC transporter [Flavimobilis marinus]SFF33671.1 ABC-2 type transport system ATP-binding protein [Flavimobilis marinus]
MITVERLTKRYGTFTAVDDLTFEVKPGRVTGFLGPNGAGKSTAMRMMVGLTTPTSGTARIGGKPYGALPNPGRHVGVLLDAGAQHPGRTGREVLNLGALMMGVDRKRVDELLDVVGLTSNEAGRRVRNYSLGMRQRLGIAGALLGDPQVLVLDEPVNGLDPAGIRWMRSLLASFAAEGGTVLLSSHLLMEMEAVSDDLVVIGHGRIVAQGAKEDLLAVPGSVVSSTDDAALAHALTRAEIEVAPHASGGLSTSAKPDAVGQVALAAGIALTRLTAAQSNGLEDLFFELTASTSREGVAA